MDYDVTTVNYATEAEMIPQASEQCEGANTGTMQLAEDATQSDSSLRNAMLNHLATNKVAHFKSQQVGEPDLDFYQKREIAEDVLLKNPGQFLSRFGRYLLSHHLDYFVRMNENEDNYEISFHLKQLRRFHCKAKNDVDVKNRRFEALKKLVKEGTYFSENEMKQRNPLLYQQLVGQYMTRREVEEQKNAVRADVTSWVNLLLAQIERDQMVCLRNKQKEDEDCAVEEMDTSDEEEDEEEDDTHSESECEVENESCEDEESEEKNGSQNTRTRKKLSEKERELLREEFVSNMYRSFLEGKDEDFDYSQVDLNPEYECLAVRSQDEEEKYFDSETPELVDDRVSIEEEEDELDSYMKNLKPEPTPCDLAGNLNSLL